MQTPLRDGVIQVKLSKPERATVRKVHSMAMLLAAMQPLNPEVTKNATTAADALWGLLRLTGEED